MHFGLTLQKSYFRVIEKYTYILPASGALRLLILTATSTFLNSSDIQFLLEKKLRALPKYHFTKGSNHFFAVVDKYGLKPLFRTKGLT